MYWFIPYLCCNYRQPALLIVRWFSGCLIAFILACNCVLKNKIWRWWWWWWAEHQQPVQCLESGSPVAAGSRRSQAGPLHRVRSCSARPANIHVRADRALVRLHLVYDRRLRDAQGRPVCMAAAARPRDRCVLPTTFVQLRHTHRISNAVRTTKWKSLFTGIHGSIVTIEKTKLN